jgi:L-threonylcarbamoyladenylate synthase
VSTILQLNPNRISGAVVRETARVIRKGGVIVYPTETIYGLGCSAFDEKAIKRIFEIKQRPETNPMLVLVRNRAMLRELVDEIPSKAIELMDCFWPGPLTIVFHAREKVSSSLTAGSGKIGVRMPGSRFCLKLLDESQIPLVSTSANISGKKASSSIHSLKRMFADKVDSIIDAGSLASSLPSTVVDVSSRKVQILREGAISRKQLSFSL